MAQSDTLGRRTARWPASTPTQLGGDALFGEGVDAVDSAVAVHQIVIVEAGAIQRRRAMRIVGERIDQEIVGLHAPTPASTRIGEVVSADQGGVLLRLIGGQMSDKATIAEGGGIAVEYEHATSVGGKSKQLASATLLVEIGSDRATSDRLCTPACGLCVGGESRTSGR
ncbi:MAG: hypothetical protein ACRDJ3_05435 [Solirubrobacteraceae bacterium]